MSIMKKQKNRKVLSVFCKRAFLPGWPRRDSVRIKEFVIGRLSAALKNDDAALAESYASFVVFG